MGAPKPPFTSQYSFPPRWTALNALQCLLHASEAPPEGWSIPGPTIQTINAVVDAFRPLLGIFNFNLEVWPSPPLISLRSWTFLIVRALEILRQFGVDQHAVETVFGLELDFVEDESLHVWILLFPCC